MDHFCSQYSGCIAVCRSACSDSFFISPVLLASTGLDRLLFDRNASAVYLGRISMPHSDRERFRSAPFDRTFPAYSCRLHDPGLSVLVAVCFCLPDRLNPNYNKKDIEKNP